MAELKACFAFDLRLRGRAASRCCKHTSQGHGGCSQSPHPALSAKFYIFKVHSRYLCSLMLAIFVAKQTLTKIPGRLKYLKQNIIASYNLEKIRRSQDFLIQFHRWTWSIVEKLQHTQQTFWQTQPHIQWYTKPNWLDRFAFSSKTKQAAVLG